MGGDKMTTIRLEGKASVGDKALVSMPDSTITKASLMAYGIPLLGLLGGMLAGDQFIPLGNSLGALIGAGTGLAAALIYLMISEKQRRSDPRWAPQIKRIIKMGETE